MKPYSCVLFDLDGTLMDTSLGIMRATDYIIETFHLPKLPEEVKRGFIGPPIQKSFQTYYHINQKRAWEIATAWRDVYKDRFLLEAAPYDGIYELLKRLREEGVKTCVATNKREDYAAKILSHFFLLPLFDCVVGSDFEGKRTKADMIRICMERIGVLDPAQCLMIGDTTGDMMAAQECGAKFIGVTYGFGFSPNSENNGIPMANSCKEIERMVREPIIE